MSRRRTAIVQLQAMLVASALVSVLAKLALPEVGAFTFVWLQVAIGGVALGAWSFGLRGERVPRGLGGRVWVLWIAIGVLNFSVVRFAMLASLERLPVNTHAFLLGFVGLATMAISAAALREPPSRGQLLGALLALFGVRVFFEEVPAPDELRGVVWVALAVLGLATTNNLTRRLPALARGRLSNDVLSTVALWIGGVPLVLAGLAVDGWPELAARDWAIVALNGLVSIGLGLTVFNHVLRTLRSYEASVLSGSGLVFTALFAMPILGEYLGWRQAVAIALMLLGMALVQRRSGDGDGDDAKEDARR